MESTNDNVPLENISLSQVKRSVVDLRNFSPVILFCKLSQYEPLVYERDIFFPRTTGVVEYSPIDVIF